MAEKPQSLARRKFRMAARQSARHLPGHLPPVWFLTDPERAPDPIETAAALPSGWGIIYRHFGQATRADEAATLAAIAAQRRLHLLVAADPRLAIAIGASGVHWPNAFAPDAVRWRDRFPIMTVSAHSAREYYALNPKVFDAALLSTVFASNSPSAGKPLGSGRLRNLVRNGPLPAYGLGGVDALNARQISGAAGIASIEGIVRAFGNGAV